MQIAFCLYAGIHITIFYYVISKKICIDIYALYCYSPETTSQCQHNYKPHSSRNKLKHRISHIDKNTHHSATCMYLQTLLPKNSSLSMWPRCQWVTTHVHGQWLDSIMTRRRCRLLACTQKCDFFLFGVFRKPARASKPRVSNCTRSSVL